MIAVALIGGICWTLAYILLAYRSFKDKSYAMPLAALALNITWEFVFSFLFPPEGLGLAFIIRNVVWFSLDVLLLIALFKNGAKYFKEEYGMGRTGFYASTVLALVLCFLVMYVGATFFAPFDYFNNDTFESAKFIAIIQNAVMSILFVRMFYARKQHGHPIEGQSFYAALMRLIGTSLTVGLVQIVSHPGNWYFVGIMVATCFLFDAWYTILMWKELKRNGINPLKRA